MKQLLLVFVVFFSLKATAQKNVVVKAAPNAIGNAGGSATVGTDTYSWTVGEPVIFTGSDASGFITQGFHQPMVCKAVPVITAYNTTVCSLPYTLSATTGFDYYQWKLGKATLVGANSADYLPVTDGSYLVWVGDSTGCYVPTSSVNVDFSNRNIIPTVTVFGDGTKDTLMQSSVAPTYQWYVITPSDGVHRAIVNATAQDYKILYNGTYYVKVNTGNDCISYSAYVVINNTGYDDITRHTFATTDSTIDLKWFDKPVARKLSVYPIPSRDKVNIDYTTPDRKPVVMNFYNVVGLLVATTEMKNHNGRIHYEFTKNDLPTGKYIVKVLDGDNSQVQGLILE